MTVQANKVKIAIHSEVDFERCFFEAEGQRANGALMASFKIYLALLEYRLNTQTEKAVFSNYDAIIVERVADISQLRGWQEATTNFLVGLIALYKEHRQFYYYCHTVIKYAHQQLGIAEGRKTCQIIKTHLSEYIGDIEEITFSEEGLTIWEHRCFLPFIKKEEQVFFFANLYFLFGALLNHLGQFQQALEAIRRGLSFCQKYPEDLSELYFLFVVEQLRALIEKGEIQEARQTILEVEANKASFSVVSGALLQFLGLKSKVYLLTGQFGQAIEVQREIGQIASNFDLHRARIITYTNQAYAQILVNQLVEAESILEEARQMAIRYQLHELLPRVELLQNLSKLRSQATLGPINLSPSLENTNEQSQKTGSISINLPEKQSFSFLNWFEDRALTFQLLLAQRAFDKAELFLENITESFYETDSTLIHCRMEVLKLMIFYYKNKIGGEDVSEAIRDYLKKEQLLPELWQFQRILSWTNLVDETEKRDLVAHNQQLLENIAANLPLENRATYLLNKWTSEEQFLAHKTEELLPEPATSWFSRLIRPFFHLKMLKRLHELLALVDQNKNQIAHQQLASSVPNDLKISLLKRVLTHPRDTTSIGFLVLPDRLVIFYYTFMKLGFEITAVGRLHFRKVIREIHELVQQEGKQRGVGRKRRKGAVSPLAHRVKAIADLLQIDKIIKKLPKRIKQIRFIPDDSLHGFPFSLLQYQSDYLIKKYAISIAYDHQLPKRNYQKLAYEHQNALLVGVTNAPGYAPLEGVTAEVKNIENFLTDKGCTVESLPQQQQTKNGLLTHLASQQMLHIACHGVFRHDAPNKTGLVLANGEMLHLRDILKEKVFSHLEHITLSSCYGADHFILPGRWVISLPETLWRAGVSSILGCLWAVGDAFAVAFMQRFYQYASSHSKIIALQKTQIDAINGQLKNTKEETIPLFYWSGFQIYS